jgi:predicted PolB exonuclease-like 3'-5' exonuclease
MLAIDIETVPLASSLEATYDPADHAPPANYKQAATIDIWHAKNKDAWQASLIKRASLSPRLGRVVSIQYCYGDTPFAQVARTEYEEAGILANFWEMVRMHQQIATWNGKGFDLPFIAVRSAILGLLPTVELPLYQQRYNHVPHFDVKHAVLGGDVRQAGEGLSEWLQAFGMPTKSGHGSEVHGMVQRGEWDALKAYGEQDALGTYNLAVRLAPFFGVR